MLLPFSLTVKMNIERAFSRFVFELKFSIWQVFVLSFHSMSFAITRFTKGLNRVFLDYSRGQKKPVSHGTEDAANSGGNGHSMGRIVRHGKPWRKNKQDREKAVMQTQLQRVEKKSHAVQQKQNNNR